MYATGPLRVRLDPIALQSTRPAEVTRRDTNHVVIRAERLVLVEWDRCLHVAQLAGHGEAETPVLPGSGSGE
jgi:hypothetical protein